MGLCYSRLVTMIHLCSLFFTARYQCIILVYVDLGISVISDQHACSHSALT
jgi:hypothetical protein